ncbi:uncharacterized protein F5Z01DRAFT_203092 [Emericellopsis atlantica]|uniref:Tyrosinase copper-binding domain-containing protein n=1 Tax=Emericellopsis atlantica TaxID=2614577 RepID=A0A9P8CSX4_9HYPO|nr:uncharacterized protein F5Z01DRAFT_203092 [Emericellopsis atlantica]KAG9258584.1 hypothetical protein F5Z01DRAFT_203092 [Emericellopsis atlantica]
MAVVHSVLLLWTLTVLVVLHSVQLSRAQAHHRNWNEAQLPKCKKLLTRKEWRTLTQSEKAEWVKAVKCLASIRHERLSFAKDHTVLEGKRSLYDDFSYTHALVEHSAHRNAYFLPWHRWFTHLFDTSLRETCGYSGPTPYWDWSRDHKDLFHSPIFEDSHEYGLGRNGDPELDCAVTTGAFASFELAWPIPHTLRRNLTLLTGWYPHELPQNRTLTPEYVRNATEQTTGDFFRFQGHMALLHNHVHNFVGGDLAGSCPQAIPEDHCNGMADSFTPNDPLFWLHHAQLDRLWNEWQRRDPSNFAAFSGMPLVAQDMSDPSYDVDANADHMMPFDIRSVSVPPKAVFDTEAWPLCYRYADEETPVLE